MARYYFQLMYSQTRSLSGNHDGCDGSEIFAVTVVTDCNELIALQVKRPRPWDAPASIAVPTAAR